MYVTFPVWSLCRICCLGNSERDCWKFTDLCESYETVLSPAIHHEVTYESVIAGRLAVKFRKLSRKYFSFGHTALEGWFVNKYGGYEITYEWKYGAIRRFSPVWLLLNAIEELTIYSVIFVVRKDSFNVRWFVHSLWDSPEDAVCGSCNTDVWVINSASIPPEPWSDTYFPNSYADEDFLERALLFERY